MEINSSLTQAWWNKLSSPWKELIILNIELAEIYTKNGSVYSYGTLKHTYEVFTGKKFKAPSNPNVPAILNKLNLLESFYINEHYSQIIYNLTPLAKLHNLTTLDIEDDTIDISFFHNPIGLSNFTSSGQPAKQVDLSPISSLTNLTKLEVTDRISNIEYLSNLTNLETLYLTNYSTVDISPISNLTNLKHLTLNIDSCDLLPIKNLTKLERLIISDSDQDLSPLSSLSNLKSLKLQFTPFDLEPIQYLSNLELLNIDTSKPYLEQLNDLPPIYLPPINLSPITQLKNLKELHLHGNESALTPIASMNNLKFLYLSNNKSELGIINTMKELQILDLQNNKAETEPISKLIKRIIDNGGEVITDSIYDDVDLDDVDDTEAGGLWREMEDDNKLREEKLKEIEENLKQSIIDSFGHQDEITN